MKTNFNVESQQFCYAFDTYKIEEINGTEYIIPDKKAKSFPVISNDRINEAMIDLLNIGKKIYYKESVENDEILEYVRNYGLFGFMSDFSMNRYYFLDNEVVLRDYNFIKFKDSVHKMNIIEYMKIFLPKLTEKQIQKRIDDCKKEIGTATMEKYLTPEINKKLIYSEDYAEPKDMFIKYAKLLYETLKDIIDNPRSAKISPILELNNLSNTLVRMPSEIGIKYNYLKQAVDLNFLICMTQDVAILKICRYCNKAFIAYNIKAEYDSPNCKNKANVYKSRAKSKK